MATSLRLGSGVLGLLLLVTPAFASAPVIQHADAIGVVLGDPVSYHVVAVGGVTSYGAQQLPAGLSIDPSTGLISGTPTAVGTYHATIDAANADGTSSTTLAISVVSPSAAPLIYAPLTFDAYNTPDPGGNMFTCTLKATGSPTSYAANGALPAGWLFSSSGSIVGTTTEPGMHVVTVNATNSYGVGSAAITVNVHPACTEIAQTTGTLTPGDQFVVTLTFNQPVSFTGTAPYLEIEAADGSTRRLQYLSGNGSSTFQFGYTVTASDPAGDLTMYRMIQPAVNGGVAGLTDSDGLTLGASLPITGPTPAGATIAAAASPAPTPVATTTAPAGSTGTGTTSGSTTPTASTPSTSTASDPVAVTTTTTTPVSNPTSNGTASTGGTASTSTASEPVASASSPAPTGSSSAAGSGTSSTAVAATGSTSTAATTSSASTTVVQSGATASTSAGGSAATAADASSRLVNLSARAAVAADPAHVLIAGFVVSGTAPKPVLVRAVGPSLASFGVANPLPNPTLKVFDASGAVVGQASDASGAGVAAAASATGAFALKNGGGDAAAVLTLKPGAYSMEVQPNGGSGVALAEIYDASTNSASGPLLNISTRGYVGGGEAALTAGFVVSGNAPRQVLIRGVGPGLGAFGVSGTLSDPVVKLYQNGTVIAANDNWETAQAVGTANPPANAAAIANAASAVGAFPLASGSRDAALLVTLPPGSYSAAVGSADGQGGAGMVEVYQVP